MLDCTISFSLWWTMVKIAIYTQKCQQKWLKTNKRERGRGGWIKMSWVEKNRKINNLGEGGDDYLGLMLKRIYCFWIFLSTFYVFLNDFFLRWLDYKSLLIRFSVLIVLCDLNNLFSVYSCFWRFSWFRVFKVPVFQGPGSGFSSRVWFRF